MTAPERIYLQGTADAPDCEDPNSGVTWCWHQIDDTDVEYVRADIAARATAEQPAALYTMDQMREFADNFYLSQLQILVAEKEAYERHAPKADRDSVIEQCAMVCDGGLDQVYVNGWVDCANERKRCAAAIRALKSQQDAAIEAKPAEQPDTQRLDWIMDNQCVLAHTRDLEGWGVIQVFYEDGDLVTRKVERLIHNTKREAIDAAIESQRSGDGS